MTFLSFRKHLRTSHCLFSFVMGLRFATWRDDTLYLWSFTVSGEWRERNHHRHVSSNLSSFNLLAIINWEWRREGARQHLGIMKLLFSELFFFGSKRWNYIAKMLLHCINKGKENMEICLLINIKSSAPNLDVFQSNLIIIYKILKT